MPKARKVTDTEPESSHSALKRVSASPLTDQVGESRQKSRRLGGPGDLGASLFRFLGAVSD